MDVYPIINPSDAYTIKGDHLVCAVAVAFRLPPMFLCAQRIQGST